MLLPSRNETFHIILAGVSGKGFLAPGNGKGTGIRKCYDEESDHSNKAVRKTPEIESGHKVSEEVK